MWLSLSVYLLLCHTALYFFSTTITLLCFLPLECPHLSCLANVALVRVKTLAKDHPPTSITFFPHVLSYLCQCSLVFFPFSSVLSLLLSFSPCPSRVQLPVSRPPCLNSINSQRTPFVFECQSACVCVLYLRMQALSTLCKCVQV